MPTQEQAGIIAAFAEQTEQLRQRIVAFLASLFSGIAYYDADQADEFAAQAAPAVLAGQTTMAQLTDAYLGLLLTDMAGDGAATPSLEATATAAALNAGSGLRGVDPTEVYQRPFKQIWYALSRGVPFDEAKKQGLDRLESIALTDLQLAKTHTVRDVLSETAQVVGYSRVLEGTYSCGLCVLASTQRYHKADLMPIHPACDCSVAPIIGEQDPGRTVDDMSLSDLHQAVRDRFGQASASGRGAVDYRDFVVTHDHGEIGPVLSRKSDHFDGPDEVND